MAQAFGDGVAGYCRKTIADLQELVTGLTNEQRGDLIVLADELLELCASNDPAALLASWEAGEEAAVAA